MMLHPDELIRRLTSSSNLVSVAGKNLEDLRGLFVDQAIVNMEELELGGETVQDEKSRIAPRANEVVTPYFVQRGGRRTLTDFGRQMIGVHASLHSPLAAADLFGVSLDTATRSMDGKVGSREDPELKKKIEEGIEKVRALSIDKMTMVLGHIKEEKVENLGAKELSIISANLGRTYVSATPREANKVIGNVTIISPQQNEESHYNVIDINREGP